MCAVTFALLCCCNEHKNLFVFRVTADQSVVVVDSPANTFAGSPATTSAGFGNTTMPRTPAGMSGIVTQASPCDNEDHPIKPWPIVYKLPVLPNSVQQALKTASDLSFISDHRTGNRTRLIQCLFEDMVTYSW